MTIIWSSNAHLWYAYYFADSKMIKNWEYRYCKLGYKNEYFDMLVLLNMKIFSMKDSCKLDESESRCSL